MSNTVKIFRGDTASHILNFKNQNGDAFSLAGLTLTITCNPNRNPTTAEEIAEELWSVIMTNTDATNGVATFALSALQADMTPKTFYYDVEAVDGSGLKKTLVKGPFIVTQDINK